MSNANGQMSNVRFVFFGTPEPAVEILDALHAAGYIPSLIVTNPDRQQGRKMVLTPSPVKKWALAHDFSFIQPEKFDDAVLYQLSNVKCQLFIVVAYGSILPKEVLSIPKCGALNLHYSLLPKYRGASPIESEILNDDREVGVSILLLDEKMDHGSIVAQQRLEIPNSENPKKLERPPKASELRLTSNKLGAELLIETIPRFVNGKIKVEPQDHAKATYTKKFTKADGEINLEGNPFKNFLKIRAFEDSIGTYFFSSSSPFQGGVPSLRGRGVKRIRVLIKEARYEDGKLILTRVVPEGKKEMGYEEFLRRFR